MKALWTQDWQERSTIHSKPPHAHTHDYGKRHILHELGKPVLPHLRRHKLQSCRTMWGTSCSEAQDEAQVAMCRVAMRHKLRHKLQCEAQVAKLQGNVSENGCFAVPLSFFFFHNVRTLICDPRHHILTMHHDRNLTLRLNAIMK